MSESANIEEMRWPDVIEAAKEKFLEIQPANMQFTAERSYAIQLLTANDFLLKTAKANPTSLQSAILNVAAIGLSLNPAKKQAYLVPRKGKVCLDPSYMGMCDLATMSGSIEWVQAKEVYAGDIEFIDNGPGEKPTHKYDARIKITERGALQLVYCVAKTSTGDYLTTIMPIDKINDIMNRSEAVKNGTFSPWKSDFLEMAKKTVVRNAFKMWPKTESLARMALAVQLSNEAEDFAPIISAPVLGQYTPEQKAYFDAMITNSNSVDMFVFTKSIDEAVLTNLYHSFEKGTKGKYQGIVDSLTQQGFAKLREYSVALSEHCQNGHDGAANELLADLAADAVAYIIDHLADTETSAYIRQLVKESQSNA